MRRRQEVVCCDDGCAAAFRVRELKLRFGIEQVLEATHCDRLGLPVFIAIRPEGRVAKITEGSHETRGGAILGAVMEAVETAVGETLAVPPHKGSFNEMSAVASVIDVASLPFKEGEFFDPARTVAWCEGRAMTSNRLSFVPFEIVALYPQIKERNLVGLKGGSTGLAAANNILEASYRALLEMIERDNLARWLAGPHMARMRSRFVPHRSAADALVYLCEVCLRQSVEPVFWRADSRLPVPTVLCQLFDVRRDQICGYATGSASDVTWTAAARRALMEAMQTRIALKLHSHEPRAAPQTKSTRLQQISMDLLRARLAPIGPMPRDPRHLSDRTLGDRLENLSRRISRQCGVEAVMIPLTHEDVFPSVVRVVAPGFLHLQ